MRKLLHVTHYPVFGGPHNQALRLTGPLRERGWDTTVVVPRGAEATAGRLRSAGIAVLEMTLHRARLSRNLRVQAAVLASFPFEVEALRRVMKRGRFDAVVMSGIVNPHAAVAAQLAGVPVTWQMVDVLGSERVRTMLQRIPAALADCIMFCGDSTARFYPVLARSKLPLVVYYPPVDLDLFAFRSEDRAEVRAELGIPCDAPLVGCVANINPEKGLEYFARMAGLVLAKCPETYFAVVGASYETHRKYRERVEREAADAGAGKRFILAGSRRDIHRYYSAFDVKVIPSVSETTSTVAMEAMACGVPVVAADVGSVADVVADGETGFVVPPQDAPALADAVLRLLADPYWRRKMGQAGRARAAERFSTERSVDAHVEALERARWYHERKVS